MRKPNPLKTRPQAGPRRYSVVIERQEGGRTVLRPLDRFGQPSGFPAHAGSRWRARKQLGRVIKAFPSAEIWVGRKL